MKRTTDWRLVLCLVASLAACGDSADTTDDENATADSSVVIGDATSGADGAVRPSDPDTGTRGPNQAGETTYHGHIRPLLEQNCVSCHVAEGGAPFTLTHDESEWTDGAPWWATSVVQSVLEGSMPPWLPEQDCRPFMHERVLSQDEIDLFQAWQEAGFDAGDPASYVPPEVVSVQSLGEPTMRLDAGEDYVADPSAPDDYRCFVVGDPIEEDLFVTAVDVKADQTSIVHHVLVYAVGPSGVDKLASKDADDDGLGYTCFGGTGVSDAKTLFAWAPGGVPFKTPEDSALLVEAGSRIVLQLHYNLAYLSQDAVVPPDRSEALIWTMPPGESPSELVRVVPFAHTGIDIEAGSPLELEENDFEVPFTATVIGVVPHMHVLGQTIRSEHISAEGESTCMVDIQAWDFNWQQFYLFEEENYISMDGGDIHRLTCTYDNSPENQPIINGEQMAPRTVGWGDGTFDEMCLSYLVTKAPFELDGGICNGVATCARECDDGDFGCFLGCTLVSGTGCISCMGTLFVECGADHCPTETTTAVDCFQNDCGDDALECISSTCSEPFNVLHGCLNQPMLEGVCNESFEPCELTF
ncbi:MAG: hypothetical protein ACPGU1_21865 [Myxococcota bacterium]